MSTKTTFQQLILMIAQNWMPNCANFRKIATTWCVFLPLFVWIEVVFAKIVPTPCPKQKYRRSNFPPTAFVKYKICFLPPRG
ncbi:MAG: hypothetical protein IJY13_00780, partial [Clostridia bacterium]|nr:hypothetical protein [Clostridia bacterium]